MGIENLKRVMWRLEDLNQETFLRKDVENAIFYEIGTDERTIKRNIKILRQLGWLWQKGHIYSIQKRDYD